MVLESTFDNVDVDVDIYVDRPMSNVQRSVFNRNHNVYNSRYVELLLQYKGHCPEHRQKDLEALIRQQKGNKDKIKEQIQLWWDEPVEAEEKWEDVSKKVTKKQQNPRSGGGGGGYQSRGGRGGFRSGDRGGRGGHGRGMNGGRGGGADRDRRRDRNGDRDRNENRFQKPAAAPPAAQEKKQHVIPGPTPVKTERPLQGAWGQRAAAPVAPAVAATPPAPPAVAPVAEPVEPEPVIDVGVVTAQDPTPAGFVDNVDAVQAPVAPTPPKTTAPPAGNVWATKGSAHIIRAEKPKPPPKPVSKPIKQQQQQEQQQPIVEQPLPTEIAETIVDSNSILPEPVEEDPVVTPPATSSPLESGLPASVNGANINAAGWKPMENNTTSAVDIVQPSPVGPVSIASAPSANDVPLLDNTETVVQEPISVPTEEPAAPTRAVPASIESLKPASALNLGHWETGDGEDNVSHDFGFGFGQENDVASVDEATNASNTNGTNNVTSVPQPTPAAPMPAATDSVPMPAAATVSPARPPPGLGIGMPPIPDQIVHVHELENKLESASLAAKKDEVSEKVDIAKSSTKETSSSTQSNNSYAGQPTTTNEAFVQMQPPGIMSQQNYTGQYNMGMYSYNAQNPAVPPAQNGFMGVHNPATAPLLSSGVLPQQKQQNVTAQQQGVGLPQQGGLYSSPSPANPTTESNTNTESSNQANPSPNNAGMPPGIPAAMQYNPALFYGQQPYQMGQHHGVGAYGFAAYGGQYGGVQGGFGYQQVMGQGAGYGQPYDDQGHGNHNSTNNHQGGYNKNSGGYRGRTNHNNHHHNQYQNQYNPQGHGGYGGQPYNMGYNDFNQRGGYGPGGHMDSSYMQNSGGYQSGFSQDDGQQMSKGKAKGGNRNFGSNNPNMHQYQQSNQQQFGGLQGASSDGVSDNNGNSGLNYQNWGGGSLR